MQEKESHAPTDVCLARSVVCQAHRTHLESPCIAQGEDGMQPRGLPSLNSEPSYTKTYWPAGFRNNLCGLESASVTGKGLNVKNLGVAHSSRASWLEREATSS